MEQLENKSNVVAEGAAAEASTSSSAVMWERFLPKMTVRVLLVEADDSTRQIITALLRKCSYRVAAVTDGLKAWEVLRGRPCAIDLILTEVDLPLISGYALLSLIMEHEICKNIPVIMMSSHDSVSTVYKCMLRGATDFLVKPVRKNELRNLWQHVWRKLAANNAAGLGPPDESIGQKKDEATAENNSASDNNSSRCMACVQQSRECNEKASDAQSSCAKLESGNDGDEDADASRNEAIDLIGALNNQRHVAIGGSASNISSKKTDAVPQLDLSLQRSHPVASVNHVTQERPRMNHSQASPFSRYISKPVMCDQQKEHELVSENRPSNHYVEHNPTADAQKHFSVALDRTGQAETTLSSSPSREISYPIHVRGVRYGDAGNDYDSRMLPIFHAQGQKEASIPSDCCTSRTPHVDHRDSSQCKNSDNLGTENLISVQTVSATFSNGNMNHHQESVNNGNADAAAVVTTAFNEESNGILQQRSFQREAALMKFRLKRKERCFDKKVRYESRKKLAEQRPRVKGQFVRQVHNGPQPGNTAAG